MGVNSAELFLNLGLCCFFCQQFDLAISCIERAQSIADDEVAADVWYNTGNVLLVSLKLLQVNSKLLLLYCNYCVIFIQCNRPPTSHSPLRLILQLHFTLVLKAETHLTPDLYSMIASKWVFCSLSADYNCKRNTKMSQRRTHVVMWFCKI